MRQPTEIEFPPLHPGQRMVADSAARYRCLAAGRRWGKTRLGSALCVAEGLAGRRAWWVAPSYKVAAVGWRGIRSLASALIPHGLVTVRLGEQAVEFASGGWVQVRSADNPDALRGEGLDLVVMDECAFIQEAAWTEALRPALSDRIGKAVFISTPKGRNWFYRMYQRGLGGGDWQSWQLPTASNPYIVASEVEAARDTLPALTFEQEYLAIFLENAGVVFRNLAACLTLQPDTPWNHAGHQIVAGVDWGKQEDFTAISVGCRDCRMEVAYDRYNQIDYSFQRDRLLSLCHHWGVSGILPERNAIGQPIIDEMIRQGVPILWGPDEQPGFLTTPSTKPQLIENLALVLEREELRYLADPLWQGELEAYERVISPVTGRSQYSAPEGMHDDTVIARALMTWAITNAPSWLLWQ